MIFQNNIWENQTVSQTDIKHYSNLFNTEPLITKLLLDRGLKSRQEVEAFLWPSMNDLHNPFLLKDMGLAVDRIQEAISKGEKICLYGDYDVDGITSISILIHYFRSLNIEVDYYIPDRHDEGYGISKVGLETLKNRGIQLVITVDCGITAVDEASYAIDLGLDLIITDHHECQEILPNAIAVINPKIEGYPFTMLAGCGVAFKLVQALSGDGFEAFYPQVIDILALGTIADIVPLYDENRVFARLGLAQMQSSNHPGIRALLKEANLLGKEVNAGHIGFVIAPRINASGRIGNPKIAVELLTTKDESKASEIAKMLSDLNSERQAREREIVEEAERYIKGHIDLSKERVLLVVGQDWHTGIIGIVASKLSEKYSRPTVILNIEGDLAKGSARSIDGISIFEILSHFKHLFMKFGGHDQAAGLTLKAKDLSTLKSELIKLGETVLPNYRLKLRKSVSGLLTPQMVSFKLLDEIDQLKPFGVGNPRPQFVFEDLIIDDYARIGKQQNHLKIVVNDGIRIYDALAFNRADLSQYLRKNDRVHMLLYLERNNFMGVETIQFMIRDIIKNRMPLSDYMTMQMAQAEATFLLAEQTVKHDLKFTIIEDFDIIFNTEKIKPLFIYSQAALMRFKDFVFAHNTYNYTIHFNEMNDNERQDGFVDVVYMPLSNIDYGHESAFVIKDALEKQSFAALVPDRVDVVNLYKRIESEIDVLSLAEAANISATKCLLGLKLIEEMGFYTFMSKGSLLEATPVPKPKEKVDIETMPTYRHLMDHWRKLSQ